MNEEDRVVHGDIEDFLVRGDRLQLIDALRERRYQEVRARVCEEPCFSEQSTLNRAAFARAYSWEFSAHESGWLEGVSRSGERLASQIDTCAPPQLEHIERYLASGWTVGPLRAEFEQHARRALSVRSASRFERAQSDYLYCAQSLRALGPRIGAKVRQYQRMLERNHAITWRIAGREDAGACHEILDSWAAEREEDDYEACAIAIKEALSGWGRLVIIEIDGSPKAFAIYETVSPNTTIALFLKYRDSIRGLSDYALRAICHAEPDSLFLNTCQDLGILGLRRKKMAMRPLALLNKYLLSPA